MEGIILLFSLLLLISSAAAEEDCTISDAEISKISDVLTHINKPIYHEEPEVVSDNEECARLLNLIHIQLRRLTQKYKLMHKGYVKVEEYQKMAQDYDRQLEELNKELDQFKTDSKNAANDRTKELRENIKMLEQNVNKLHQDLGQVSEAYDRVQKSLCLSYLESNQISKAKSKLKHLNSKYLIELIQQFLNNRNGSVLPVIDFSSAVPDLDDRGEAYKTIYSFLESTNKLETDDSLLLEAVILKMNANFGPGSNITDYRKNELREVLQKLSVHSDKTLSHWTEHLNQSMNMVVIKNTVDHLFLTQMKILGDKIGARKDVYAVRNLLKLLALSNNHHKIAAYKALLENEVGHASAMIWLDLVSMDYAELLHDVQVADLFNRTYELLPNSLRKLHSCRDSVHIYHVQNGTPRQCIVVSRHAVEVPHPDPTIHQIFGHFTRVLPQSTDCTRYRLELSSDRASVRIVSKEGDALTNINSAVIGNVWFSQVGAPYVNHKGMHLDTSEDWILETNQVNDTIKIQSEFSAYQGGRSIDHLLIKDFGRGACAIVGRYGALGLKRMGVQGLEEWEFDCAAK